MPPKRQRMRLQQVDYRPPDSQRMWPLDVSAAALGGLVLLLILTNLSWHDPRPLYNAGTYLILVVVVSLALAFLLRTVTSKFLRKSIQIGFLFSLCMHLLMLIFAVNVIVFTAFQPMATKGESKKRTPIRKTVPEHIFQTPRDSEETPDWSKPVDSETASRVVPKEARQLPPVVRSQPRLEVPKPRQPEKQPMQKSLMERDQPTPSQPKLADSPGKLARRISKQESPKPTSNPIEVPENSSSATQPVEAQPSERQLANSSRSSAASRAASQPERSSESPDSMPVTRPRPLQTAAASNSPDTPLPRLGDAGLTRMRRSRSISAPAAIAGSAPAPLTVSVAQQSPTAAMMLSPAEIPTTRSGETSGAQLSSGQAPSYMAQTVQQQPSAGTEVARNTMAASAGSPTVNAGSAERAPGRARRANVAQGFAPIGSANPIDSLPQMTEGTTGQGREQGTSESLEDRLADTDGDGPAQRSGETGGANTGDIAPSGAPDMSLDLLAELDGIGIGREPAAIVGLMPGDMQPEIASMELPREGRPRREVGGPATPAGTQIAAVESFSRRVMRTSGGTSSSAPGMGGPATEEAIERGLAYLASVQNEDGSWSLQGHGDAVILQSDTAATGLCLLAFQGAGYTHLQHQYANTVSKGLKFLLDNQRSSGNLYRSENPVSDENVMLYSHGIASLALCEAYGMTQDRELRTAAQDALDYIVNTQHVKRGGWRYTPQISSDTSVTGWMMMALKSGDLAGLEVPQSAYDGIDKWLSLAQQSGRMDRYRYDPFAPDTAKQRHGRLPSPTMTAVGMLMRMYNGWRRDNESMQSAAEYLLRYPPRLGDQQRTLRDGYYWYYATQVMFHMGDEYWERWNGYLNPLLLDTQIKRGPESGSWDPELPVRDRWGMHAGRLYVTTMNLLNLEVYYRHLPIYEDTAAQ
ncbi:MAG: hypothetical protein AAFX06_26025 [Planctomycetota bacterium]